MSGLGRDAHVVITEYKWAGKFGPVKIKSHCEECDLTAAILKKMLEEEFKDKDVVFEIKPWLDNIFYCLFRGAWHPPIIMVNGRKFFQFSEKKPLFDKRKLVLLVNSLLTQKISHIRHDLMQIPGAHSSLHWKIFYTYYDWHLNE